MTEDNTVLITGASGGVGRATVTLFSEKGWKVVGVDRSGKAEDFPESGLFIQADISNPDNIKRVYEETSHFSDHLNAVLIMPGIKLPNRSWKQPSKNGMP